jgi:tetratricopeptide (TPR) repeat protein
MSISDRVGDQEAAAAELTELLEKRRKEEAAEANSDDKNIFTFEDGDTIDLRLPPDVSFANELPMDAEGYRPITWTQLKKKFWYERTAHKFKLTGDISQREDMYWDRSKQIKVRDSEGVERALFFYDDNPEPHFSFDDLRVGNTIVIRSPRFHRFMDSQEGMRVEEAKSIASVTKIGRFTDKMRMDYGLLCKNNGTMFFNSKKYEDAAAQYMKAIGHLEGTFHDTPEFEPTAKMTVAQCFLNIAACRVAEAKWEEVEEPCERALVINASAALNAKAYFRLGQACIEQGLVTAAREKLTRAVELAPGDPVVSREIDRLNSIVADQRSAQTSLFASLKGRVPRPDGILPAFGFKPTPFSSMSATLNSVPNFRDLSVVPLPASGLASRRRIRPYLLYRSSSLFSASPEDISRLTHELGVKTVIDLRYEGEADLACSTAQSKANKLLKDYNTVYPDETDDDRSSLVRKEPSGAPRPPKPSQFVDYRNYYHPAAFKKSYFIDAGTVVAKKQVLSRAKQISVEALVGNERVNISVDFGARAVITMTAYWVLLVAAFLTAVFQFRAAAKLVVKKTVQRVGALKLYQSIIEKQHTEIRKVIELLSIPSNYPVVVCCSLGKDRTGIVAMLALSIVGASDDAIADDFAKTTHCLTSQMKKMQQKLGLGPEWDEAKRETMLDLLRYIRDTHGSVERFLTDKVKVPAAHIQSIRRILLDG